MINILYKMKEKIIDALKTKYANLGFGAKAFDGVAEYLAKTVTEETHIETAVSGVEPLLKVFQSDIDRERTEKTALQRQLDEMKKATPPVGGGEGNSATDEGKPEWFRKWEEQKQAELDGLKKKVETAEVEKSRSERNNLILSKAKELLIPQWRIKEGFAITDDMDQSAIGNYLAAVKQNITTAGLERGNTAFPLSTSEAQGKEDAKNWAKNLPDINN